MNFCTFVICMAAIASASEEENYHDAHSSLQEMYDADSSVQEPLGKIDRLKNGVNNVYNGVKERVKKAYKESLQETLDMGKKWKLAAKIYSLYVTVQEKMMNAEPANCGLTDKENVENFTQKATRWAKTNIEPAMATMNKSFKAAFDKLPKKAQKTLENIQEQIKDFVQNLNNSPDPEELKAEGLQLLEDIKEQLQEVFDVDAEKVQEGHQETMEQGQKVMEGVEEFARNPTKGGVVNVLTILTEGKDVNDANNLIEVLTEMVVKFEESLVDIEDLQNAAMCLNLDGLFNKEL